MAGPVNSSQKTIRNEATVWFARINSGDATVAEHAEHARWMAADPRHLREYMQLAAIWSDMGRVADYRLDLPVARHRHNSSRRWFLAGGAATLATAGLIGANLPIAVWTSDYSTDTGEQKSVSLPDGSTVDLDAETAITLNFSERTRRLRLVRGRAFFIVAKDAARPFVVEAANGRTTALGTRFGVHEWRDSVTVSVEESSVSVVAPDRTTMVLHQGEDITYSAKGGMGVVGQIDADTETSWRRGKLIFKNRPLGQVIADVNRYRFGLITLADSRLVNLRVSGIFAVDNPDGVLDAITSALPIKAMHITRYLVLLRAA